MFRAMESARNRASKKHGRMCRRYCSALPRGGRRVGPNRSTAHGLGFRNTSAHMTAARVAPKHELRITALRAPLPHTHGMRPHDMPAGGAPCFNTHRHAPIAVSHVGCPNSLCTRHVQREGRPLVQRAPNTMYSTSNGKKQHEQVKGQWRKHRPCKDFRGQR